MISLPSFVRVNLHLVLLGSLLLGGKILGRLLRQILKVVDMG